MAVETVTLLFTDLVGSTSLMSSVGEAAMEAIRREHMARLRDAIGVTGGREVKNLGDGLMVAFSGAGAALSCAIAMQQSTSAQQTPAGAELAIRIGVATGEVDVVDDDYFGVPVVEASRLCAAAGAGEILTTELVAFLVRSRGGFELEGLGGIELKGLPDPVETFRLRWSPTTVGDGMSIPVPRRVVDAAGVPAVGRVSEHEQLATAWKDVQSGRRWAVFTSGEPGIGKTTIVSQFALEAAEQGGSVLFGRCDEDIAVPYQPWAEALGHLVKHVGEDVIAAHLDACGGVLGRVVPEVARRASIAVGSDLDVERHLLMAAVLDLLERAAEQAPLIVVLDDLHWADPASVQLLRHLLLADTAAPLLVLGTFRDSDIGADHALTDLLARLRREPNCVRVSLGGLGDDDVLMLLERLAGHAMDSDGLELRDVLLAETDGNPFFVGEMLRHLAESGAIAQDSSGRWAASVDLAELGLPVSIREVVTRRVRWLGADTQRLLSLASVIGREFDIELLAAVADLDTDDAIELCDAAVAASVLRETGRIDRYAFAHALIERTLYDELSMARRSRAHRAVAEAIEAQVGAGAYARASELAHHWTRAVSPTDSQKASHYCRLAGDRALDQLAPDEALRWYSKALELVANDSPDARERVEILIGVGSSQGLLGVADFRETLLEASRLADRHDFVDLLVRAVLANNRGMLSNNLGVDHARVEMIDRALERLPPGDTPERARLLSIACLERVYGVAFEERFRLAEQAVATARACGDPDVLVTTTVFCCDGIYSPATASLRRRWIDEIAPLADSLTNPATRYLLHNNARYSAVEWADVDAIRASDLLANQALGRLPHRTLQWNNSFHKVWQELLWGDLDEAERLAEAAVALGIDCGAPDAMLIFGGDLMVIRDFQGRLSELIPLIEQSLAVSPSSAAFRGILAWALASSGREADAWELLDADVPTSFDAPDDYNWSVAQSVWAEASARIGHHTASELIYERLRPFDDLIVSATAMVRLAVPHYLGLLDHSLERLDAADERFAQAMALHERLGSPLHVASTQAAWAALLTDRNRGDDRTRALHMAQAAIEVAAARGYGSVERDGRKVLEQLA